MEGQRRAVLAPRALPATDEHGVMNRLGGTDRERLTRLLEELDRLGMTSDPSLLVDAGGRPPAAPLSSRIREASAAQMLAILSREPAGLIAAVLRIESWPWEASFLARLDPQLRQGIVAAMQKNSRVSGKLAGTLRSALELRLGAAAPRKRSRRPWEILSRALARWFR